jgi:hypothetical protein
LHIYGKGRPTTLILYLGLYVLFFCKSHDACFIDEPVGCSTTSALFAQSALLNDDCIIYFSIKKWDRGSCAASQSICVLWFCITVRNRRPVSIRGVGGELGN